MIDALLLAVAWLILVAGSAGSWIVGVPAIAVALWVRGRHRRGGPDHFRGKRLVEFAVYFFRQSLRAGTDVALRAFGLRRGLSCALLAYRTSLPPGEARIFFANIISLLPGTLTAGLDEDALVIHILDDRRDATSDLQTLENHVAGLFGVGTSR